MLKEQLRDEGLALERTKSIQATMSFAPEGLVPMVAFS